MMIKRYRNLGNGAVRDAQTCLCWLREPLKVGQCDRDQGGFWQRVWRYLRWVIRPERVGNPVTAPASVYTWAEALQATEAFNRTGGCAGYQDWRLPHRGELKTLLNRPQHPAAFPGASAGRFWTAWPHRYPRYAWFVDFGVRGPVERKTGLVF
ncbi:MAG: DUF1566 domain-containing protein [Candidatus Competibacteraceae bacterium]|nr:DUF1566 domain-containing protein [Candidatus Competibacteraceae bacterium]